MSPAVAKKKKRLEDTAAQIALDEHEAMIEERYEYALAIKQTQDESTVVAINRMVVRMKEIAGEPRFIFRGTQVKADHERLKSIQIKSLTWFAVRMFVACAEWDIRIANFKPPAGICAKCGKKGK